MRKQVLVEVLLCVSLAMFLSATALAPETQRAWLRMYASDSIYVADADDPWIVDTYVVMRSPTASSISLAIIIENIKGDSDVYQIVMPIVTNDTTAIASIEINGTSLSPLDWTTGQLDMTTDGGVSLGKFPPHGVYDDPEAYWIEYRTGINLTAKDSAGSSLALNVTVNFIDARPNNAKIHFDAYGWTDGEIPVIIDDALDAAFAPFSKDITIRVPEWEIGVIVTISTGFCGYLLMKRQLMNK